MQFPLASCYCFHVRILSTAPLPHTMYYEPDGPQKTWKLLINFSFHIFIARTVLPSLLEVNTYSAQNTDADKYLP
jgi:hypothetical protein